MKLTLRDLFWLVAVVGLMLGWWVERTRLIEEIDRLTWEPHFSGGFLPAIPVKN